MGRRCNLKEELSLFLPGLLHLRVYRGSGEWKVWTSSQSHFGRRWPDNVQLDWCFYPPSFHSSIFVVLQVTQSDQRAASKLSLSFHFWEHLFQHRWQSKFWARQRLCVSGRGRTPLHLHSHSSACNRRLWNERYSGRWWTERTGSKLRLGRMNRKISKASRKKQNKHLSPTGGVGQTWHTHKAH